MIEFEIKELYVDTDGMTRLVLETHEHISFHDYRNMLINHLSPFLTFDARIKKVIFNKPATIILWANGDKTVVKCSKDDIYDPEIGFVMAVIKHDRPDFKKLFKKYYKEETNNE